MVRRMAEEIRVYGAREHNLKDINLALPRNKLIVFCGVSGSGKSSLAIDTIYAEGRRRYIEALSVDVRRLLQDAGRPDVDHIEGLSPAIAIDQKSGGRSPRSTVGTITDIYDYLRVLFAKVGQPFCYQCGAPISATSSQQIVDELLELPENTLVHVLAPVENNGTENIEQALHSLRRRGYARARVGGRIYDLAEGLPRGEAADIAAVVDRLIIKPGVESRLAESVEIALKEGDQTVIVCGDGDEEQFFSTRFACPRCKITYPELTPSLFSFNTPVGMCPECEGLGTVSQIDPDLLVAAPERSILDGALRIVGDVNTRHTQHKFEGLAEHYGFDLSTPWRKLPEEIREVILYGSGGEEISFRYRAKSGREFQYTKEYQGIVPLAERQRNESSQRTETFYEQFFTPQPCPACGGSRLRPEARSVRVGGKTIFDITSSTVAEAIEFFEQLSFSGSEQLIAEELVEEITARLHFMQQVGVGYLTLDRSAPTLAGGEAERIRLATQIGSGLAGVMYILDEPSIGLHPRDQERLIDVLRGLRDLGNTVIIVEHDPQTIQSADYVVEFGPGAGTAGGNIVHTGTVGSLKADADSLTGQYLTGQREVPVPKNRRKPDGRSLQIRGASEHNLKKIDVEIPLGLLVCVTGVSGSGKSTLINDTVYPLLARKLQGAKRSPGRYQAAEGVELLEKVINIDQSPIGRTPRSTAATYVRVFGPIRELFAQTQAARMRGYSASRFSFNVTGGRCEVCSGDGTRRVEMHLLPDIYVPCEVCGGTRYNRETLQIRYKGKNIADVLEMTVAEAREHFRNIPKIRRILTTLCEVGLDYICLGQPAPTLSGGEAQRVKLARELARVSHGDTIYLLDEPTTGLHFADVEELLAVLHSLTEAGNTVVVIEHNLDVIKAADYIIDLGPEGGQEGGEVVVMGTPEQVAACDASYTGRFLRQVLND